MIRIAVVAGIVFSIGVLLLWAFTKRGWPGDRCAPAIAGGVVAFTYVGLLQAKLDLSPLMGTAFGLMFTVAGVLTIMLATRRWQRFDAIVLAALSAAVASPILLALVNQPASAQTPVESDVVILILDGYAGSGTMEAIYGRDNSGFEAALAASDFSLVPNAVVGYSMTYASIASLLEMDYVVDPGYTPDAILRPDLYSRMQGDNAFVRAALDRGYEYVHLESGWGGSQCGALVERCVRAPFLEETVWNFLQRTALSPMMEVWFGHSFPSNGVDRLQVLADLELDAAKSELVFAHILIPHPPLFVDDLCQVRYREELAGMNVGTPYFAEAVSRQRRRAYAAQVECTNRMVMKVLENPSFAGAMFVIVGDHGSDALGQLVTPVTDWSKTMIAERMTTLAAVRGCTGDPPVETINLFRWVANCAFELDLPLLTRRQFLVPVTENHPGDGVIEVQTQ